MWRSVLVGKFHFLLSTQFLMSAFLMSALLLMSIFAEPLFAEEDVSPAPDLLEHYHFVPQHSTLNISGGFAGVDYEYSVEGDYDLIRFFRDGNRRARFYNAEVVSPLLNGFPAYIDVDELLGLEELNGGVLPAAGPFEIYHFSGETFDNSKFSLYTAFIGPWMYLQGTSFPPQGSADFFKYEINALARTRPSADMNNDGIVDAADYTIIRDSGGAELLNDWTAQYGEQTPSADEMQLLFSSAISTASASAAAVPEPSTTLLMMIGLAAIAFRQRG